MRYSSAHRNWWETRPIDEIICRSSTWWDILQIVQLMRYSRDRPIDEIFYRSSNWWDILQIVQLMRYSADRPIDEIFCRLSNWWDILQIVQLMRYSADRPRGGMDSILVLLAIGSPHNRDWLCELYVSGKRSSSYPLHWFIHLYILGTGEPQVSYPTTWYLSLILGPLYWSSLETIQTKEEYSAVTY